VFSSLLLGAIFVSVGQSSGSDALPPGAIARLGTTCFRHEGKIRALAFAPDGRTLATAAGRIIHLWDTATGKKLHTFEGQQDHIAAVAFSPEGNHLASGAGSGWNGNGDVTMWDIAGRKALFQIASPLPSVWSLAFSANGKALLVGNDKGEIRIYDAFTGQELRRVDCHSHAIRSLACTSDGKAVAANSDNMLGLWSPGTGTLLRYLGQRDDKDAPYDGSTKLATAGKCPLLAVGCWRDPVQVWDLAAGKVLRTFKGHHECIYEVALSPDGRVLAAAGGDTDAFVWDVQTGKDLHRLGGHFAEVRGLAFSPDGRTLATASGGAARLWNVTTGRELFPTPGNQAEVACAIFSPDDTQIATAGGRAVLLWERATGRLMRTLATDGNSVDAVAFAPDGKVLTAWGWGERPHYWETQTGKERSRFPELTDYRLGSMNFSADLKMLASWRRRDIQVDYTLHLWDATSGKELQSIKVHLGGYNGFDGTVVFSPDGRVLAAVSGSFSNNVALWDAKTGKELGVCHPKGILGARLIFSPDGTLLAAAGREGQVELWHVASQKHFKKLKGPERTITCLAFSPDGRTVVAGEETGAVRLWEVATAGERRCLRGHRGAVRSVAFSPDGRALLSAGADTTAIVWDTTGFVPSGLRSLGHEAHDVEGYWADLAGKDAAKAYRAVWALALGSETSRAFLRARWNLDGSVAPQIERLITGLNADQFDIRNRSARDLERLGEVAEPALRRARAEGPSLDVRRRAGELVEKLEDAQPSTARLRALRAVEVLQLQGGQASRLLEAAARWSPEPWVTHEARAVLSQKRKAP
jgi:WD40 repeat protein